LFERGDLLQRSHFSPWHASIAKEPTINTKVQATDTLKGAHHELPIFQAKMLGAITSITMAECQPEKVIMAMSYY
jgi:hypothetical protein